MAEYISREIREATEALAKLIRADKRYQAYEAAAEVYEKDPEVLSMITEYNVHQAALSEQFAHEERNEEMIACIQKRIDFTILDPIPRVSIGFRSFDIKAFGSLCIAFMPLLIHPFRIKNVS